jgi:hypothetical protein
MRIGGGNRGAWRKPALVPLFPPQEPHNLFCNRTRKAEKRATKHLCSGTSEFLRVCRGFTLDNLDEYFIAPYSTQRRPSKYISHSELMIYIAMLNNTVPTTFDTHERLVWISNRGSIALAEVSSWFSLVHPSKFQNST